MPFPTNQVVYLGDSIMLGNHVPAGDDLPSKVAAAIPQIAANSSNQAIGSTYANEDGTHTDGGQGITADGMFNSGVQVPVCVVFFGSNDLATFDAPTFVAAYKTYCLNRRSAGYKIVACTPLPNQVDATHQGYVATASASIRADTSFYDALADFNSDAIMGDPTTHLSTTYYDVDTVHPNNAGNDLLAPYLEGAIRGLMAFTLIAHTFAQSSGAGSVTTTGIDTTGANLITIVTVGVNNTNPLGNVTDNKGNGAATNTTAYDFGGAFEIRISYYSVPTVGAGHTFTVGAASTFPSVFVAAWSGAATSSVFDVLSAGSNNTGTGTSGGSITPNQANSLIISGCIVTSGGSDVASIDSGFTLLDHAAVSGGNAEGGSLSYLIQGAAAAVNPTTTFNAGGVLGASINAAFKPGSSTTNYTLNGDTGSYVLAGVDAAVTSARSISVATGSYVISGVDATLTVSSITNYTLNVDTGVYTISGFNAKLTWSGAPPVTFPQCNNTAVMGLG